jgi:hypothetical protein
MLQFSSPYDFNNKRAFESKMRSLKKINIFKRIKYSEMLVRLQCHISEAFYKDSCEKKKEAQAGGDPKFLGKFNRDALEITQRARVGAWTRP